MVKNNNKKAAIEIQFNWIFIMIAGVVILGFFIVLAGKINESSQKELAVETVTKLSAIATSSQVSENTNDLMPIKNLKLRLDCMPECTDADGCAFDFDFDNFGLPAPAWMEVETVFAPILIEGNFLIPWSLEWESPYKITNFLYLTSGEHKYVLVYNEPNANSVELAEEVFDKFSENDKVALEIIDVNDIGTITYNGESMIKFIFFFDVTGVPIPDLDSELLESRRWDVSFITGSEDSGTVYFSKIEMNAGGDPVKVRGEGFPYIGMPMLIGGIYSDTLEYYQCSVFKALIKFRKINKMYLERTTMLDQHYTDNPSSLSCEIYYDTVFRNKIISLNSSVDNFETLDLNDVDTMLSIVEEIKQQNKILSGRGCPPIY